MSNPKRLRGIAETIAAARASLDEPSRPYTPSNLDNRMSLDSGSRGTSRAKTRLESMILPNSASMQSSVPSTGKTTGEYQNFMMQLRDLGDAIQSIDQETTHHINSASIESISSYTISVIKSCNEISKVIRKNAETVVSSGLRDILSVGGDMVELLNKWTGEFSEKLDLDMQYPLCRCTLRYYLDLIKVAKTREDKAPSFDLVKHMQRVSGMIYRLLSNQRGGALIGNHHDSAVHTLLLDLLEILWRRLPACLKSVLTSQDADCSELQLLLEAGKYAAGSLRILSKDEGDQKNLVRCKAIEYIATGVKIVCLIPIKQLQKSSQGSGLSAGAHKLLLDTIADTVVQLLGAIRNFSVDKDNHSDLLQFETVGSLCCLLTLFSAYPTVQLNCARVTAKLSLYEPFRAQINSESKASASASSSSSSAKGRGGSTSSGGNVCLKQFSAIVLDQAKQCRQIMESSETQHDSEELGDWPAWHTWLLLSRVCFTLGNLTTTNDVNRRVIGVEYKVAGSLVTLLQACSASLSELHSRGIDGEDDESPDEDEDNNNQNNNNDASFVAEKDDNAAEEELRDATIKLLRLLANLSIESEIGMELTSNLDTLEILLQLLRSTSEEEKHEELLLNTVAACTNITFFACQQLAQYADGASSSLTASANKSAKDVARDTRMYQRMESKLVELSLAVTQCLFHDNDEIVLETTRVLGNLTRRPAVLVSVVRNRTDEALILLLRHGNVEIVSSVVGTLINLSADPTSKKSLLDASSNVFEKFAELLRKISIRHVLLHTLICQTLHNLLVTNASAASLKDREDFTHVSHSIQDSLTEKVDIVEDYAEEEYVSFVRVARVVLKQLFSLG